MRGDSAYHGRSVWLPTPLRGRYGLRHEQNAGAAAVPVINRIAEFHAEMAAWRRDLHAHPELGFEEARTAAVVARLLREFGCDAVATGLAGTGVVGVIKGRGTGGGTIALCADMDALPIQEETGLPYASAHPGRMHACGHDGHTAMLLGAAKYLAEARDFGGTVHLIFQPAEEGGGGARAMVEEAGLFDRFPCDAVYAVHNDASLPLGAAAAVAGTVMAAVDFIHVMVRGRGGHAAEPHRCVDPVLAGARVVEALQGIVARRLDPLDSAVVSMTTFHAGSGLSVIPQSAELRGTVRTLSAAVRDRVEALLAEAAAAAAATVGATARCATSAPARRRSTAPRRRSGRRWPRRRCSAPGGWCANAPR
jgi:amidohydrolase